MATWRFAARMATAMAMAVAMTMAAHADQVEVRFQPGHVRPGAGVTFSSMTVKTTPVAPDQADSEVASLFSDLKSLVSFSGTKSSWQLVRPDEASVVLTLEADGQRRTWTLGMGLYHDPKENPDAQAVRDAVDRVYLFFERQ